MIEWIDDWASCGACNGTGHADDPLVPCDECDGEGAIPIQYSDSEEDE